MVIALPFENNNIFGYYEHASSFKIYEVEHGKIARMRFIPINDLADIKIDIMLCGKSDFSEAGLENNAYIKNGYKQYWTISTITMAMD